MGLQPPTGRLDAVLLDLGGVLWQPNGAVIAAALRRHGVGAAPDALDRALYAGQMAMDAAPDDDATPDVYLRAYAQSAGVAEDRVEAAIPDLDDAFESLPWEPRLLEESRAALRALAGTGVALAIVSNASGTAEQRLREHALCQVGEGPGTPVAAVVDSGVVGVAKPDPAIFEIALRAAGVPPRNAVHVGDSLRTDVAGAYNAGIEPVHFDPYGLCPRDDHAHVVTLWEVVELVERSQDETALTE